MNRVAVLFRNPLLINSSQRFTSRLFSTSSNSPKQQQKPTCNKLKLSDSCVKRLREICNDGSFLRITVDGGGCSGFQYKFDIDTKLEKEDLQFGPEDAKVVIDETSIDYVAGSTIDFHTELIRSGFRIVNNPKAEHNCSCGASFSIKID